MDLGALNEERREAAHTGIYDPAPPIVRESLHLENARGLGQFGESDAGRGVGERVGRRGACPNPDGGLYRAPRAMSRGA